MIGSGCDCLIPAQPPKEAIEARRRQANRAVEGDHYHTVANPAKGEKSGERAEKPCLATVRIGDDPASHTYVWMKANRCRGKWFGD